MAPNTIDWKIILPDQIDPKENRFNNEQFERAVWFVEDLISGDALNFCERYLHLPDYESMFRAIYEYYTKIKNPMYGLRYTSIDTGTKYMIRHVPKKEPRYMIRHIDHIENRTGIIKCHPHITNDSEVNYED